MKCEHLEHLLRAVAAILHESDLLVLGSQSILGTYAEEDLPADAILSVEADIGSFDDPDDAKADLISGAIGEGSLFDQTFGYFADGVTERTATLPVGWRGRLVRLESSATNGARGWCLEPHDCAVAKLAADRPKDHSFVAALLVDGKLLPDVLFERLTQSPALAPEQRERLHTWIEKRAPRR